MKDFKFDRRSFLATSGVIGAAGFFGLPLFASEAEAQAKKLIVRVDTDLNILDPAFMIGGSEIEIQKAVLPALVEFDGSDGSYGWRPSAYVETFAQRDETHFDFTLKPGFMWTGGNGELLALSGERSPYPGKLGVVEQGALADLLLVDGDPIANIQLVADPAKNFLVIMKDGKIYKNTLR